MNLFLAQKSLLYLFSNKDKYSSNTHTHTHTNNLQAQARTHSYRALEKLLTVSANQIFRISEQVLGYQCKGLRCIHTVHDYTYIRLYSCQLYDINLPVYLSLDSFCRVFNYEATRPCCHDNLLPTSANHSLTAISHNFYFETRQNCKFLWARSAVPRLPTARPCS